jgi:hypothetical protein
MHLSLEASATYIDNASTKKSFLPLHQGTSKRAIQTKSLMLRISNKLIYSLVAASSLLNPCEEGRGAKVIFSSLFLNLA